METLPVEIYHRIFDNLDVETLIFSIRSISRLFQSVVKTYNRFIFNGTIISKPNFYCFCRLIKPENILSLVLSNDKGTSNQIDLFFSLVNFQELIRLRSLTLLDINEDQLNFILNHFNWKSLTSFSFQITHHTCKHMDTTIDSLFSTFEHSNLRQLEFDLFIYGTMSKLSWPNYCPIESLIINSNINIDSICTILQCSPHLHTFVVKGTLAEFNSDFISKSTSQICFQQLKSLTIINLALNIDKLESFLLLTPSLIYLKLTGGQNMIDGKRWEQFIQTNLCQLDKFEFFFHEWLKYNTVSDDPQRLISSFQTSFWREHKKWFVTYECDVFNFTTIHIYTIPLCKSCVLYQPEFQKFSTSKVNESISMNNVKSLILDLNKELIDDLNKAKTEANTPLFPQVYEIDITITSSWMLSSLEQLSKYIDIVQITQMKLKIHTNISQTVDLNSFFQQASNLSSLSIGGNSSLFEPYRKLEYIYIICPTQLKHLEIPITNINQLEIIFQRCQKLLTIILLDRTKYSNFSDKIIEWLQNNTMNSTCKKDFKEVIVWIGKKKLQSIHDDRTNPKRIKL